MCWTERLMSIPCALRAILMWSPRADTSRAPSKIARSTVLRDVLVPAHGAVVDTIFIAPGASCSLVHTSFRRRAPSAQTRKRGANSCCVEENSCLIGTAGRDSHDSDREYDELHMHHDRSALCFGSSFESGFLYGKFKVAPLMALLISSLRAWSIW